MRIFCGVVVIFALLAGDASAQLLPRQRTAEEEKKFGEWQYRLGLAKLTLDECVQKEIERDFAKFVGIQVVVTKAIDTCSAQVETFAHAGCVGGIILPGEQGDAEARHKEYCVQSTRKAQIEAWAPILLKRRVELQPD